MKLRIFGKLAVECLDQTAVILLDGDHPVFKHADCLDTLGSDHLDGGLQPIKGLNCRVEEMKNILEAGVSRQMHPVALELRGLEAGDKKNVRSTSLEDAGETGQDLRHSVAVPHRASPVHGRGDDEETIRVQCSMGVQDFEGPKEDGLNAEGHGGLVAGLGEEVGQAGDDDDGGLSANGAERLGEHGEATDLKSLTAGHQRTISAVGRVHVPLDVRIAQQRKAA